MNVLRSVIRNGQIAAYSQMVIPGQANALKPLANHKRDSEADNPIVNDDRDISNPLSAPTHLHNISPILPPSFSLAAFVNKSELLKQLINLGVSIHQWDKMTKKQISSWILKMDFTKDVQPTIQFLVNKGVDIDLVGKLLTKNPEILKESIEDLEVRTNYLLSKKFTAEMISKIYSRNPFWLLYSTEEIDKRLGFFQQLFKLTGNQLRLVATKEPRLMNTTPQQIKLMNFGFQEEMGFEVAQIKSLLIAKPKLWIMNKNILVDRFDYLHNVVKMDHATILQFPAVLTCREFRIRQRHEFLQHMNRAQYDPKLPQYVSPLDLIRYTDSHFAANIAKTTVAEFNDFLKTL
nr:EOG090X0C5Y [Ilyocryptus agilis]